MRVLKQSLAWFEVARKRRLFWISAAVLLVLLLLYLRSLVGDDTPQTAYYEVKRGDFLVTIVEGGTLEAVQDLIIRCEVEGNARIIYIVPEGTYVKKGDLLVKLDTAEANDKVNQQEITCEKAKSTFIQAEKNLEILKSEVQSSVDTAQLKVEFARIDQEKFKKGQMLQELRNAEIEITTATSDLLLAKNTLDWSVKLFEQGFETKNNVDQGQNNVQDLTLRVEKAQTNLWVLSTFDHPKFIRKYQSDLDEAGKELERVKAQGEGKLAQAMADLITQSNSLQLITEKLENDKKQLTNSTIYAPQDGLVVYCATQSRFSSQSLIEEGAMVRERQEIVKLPDTSAMKVTINIHESHVGKVRPGQPAYVVLDSLPDQRYKAQVTKVAVLPDTQSRFGNPNLKVYKTEVLVTDKLPDVKPGVSARAEIVITNVPNAITAPIQAITSYKGQTVVFLKKGSKPEPVPVEVGLFNTKFIEVTSGLQAGSQILLSPPFDIQEKDLGGAIIGRDEKPPTAEPLPPSVGVGTLNGSARPEGSRTEPLDSSGVPPSARSRDDRPAGPGSDQRGTNRPPGGRSGPSREEMLKQFDKNGDGQLDEAERAAMRERSGGRGLRDRTE